MIDFKLLPQEEIKRVKYLDKIKSKYGSYGLITYSFKYTGIGCVVKMKSSHIKKWKNITDYGSW